MNAQMTLPLFVRTERYIYIYILEARTFKLETRNARNRVTTLLTNHKGEGAARPLPPRDSSRNPPQKRQQTASCEAARVRSPHTGLEGSRAPRSVAFGDCLPSPPGKKERKEKNDNDKRC